MMPVAGLQIVMGGKYMNSVASLYALLCRTLAAARWWWVILAAIVSSTAFAQNDNGSGDCLENRLMPLLVAHRFTELEIEFKTMAEQATAQGNVARRICARHILGGIQGRLEKYDEALSNLRAALEDATNNLPEDHSQIHDTREMIASVLGKSGDRAGEIKIYKELIPQYERKYRPISEKYAALLRNLANANAWIGDYLEVVRLDRQVLAIKLRLAKTSVADFWKLNHIPAIAQAEIHLAESLLRIPDGYKEGMQLAEKSLPELVAAHGPHHPDVLNAQLVLALAKSMSGDKAAGLDLVRETFNTASLKLGNTHPVTRKAENDLAVALSKSGQSVQAVDLNQKHLATLVAKQGAGHPETIHAYANLSGKLIAAKKMDEAIAVLEESLNGALAVRRTLDFDPRIATAWQATMRQMVENYLYALASTKRYTDAFLAAEFFKTRLLSDRLALDAGELKLLPSERKEYRAAILNLAKIEQELAVRRSLKQNVGELEAKRLRSAELLKTFADSKSLQKASERMPNSKSIPPWAGMVMVLDTEKSAYVSFIRIHGHIFAISFSSTGQILFAPIAPAKQLREMIAVTRQLMQPPSSSGVNAIKVWKSADGPPRVGLKSGDNEEEVKTPDGLLSDLGKTVLKRLEPILAGRQNLVISTDDMLAHLPFGALPYNGKPLAQSYSISMVPSLEVLIRVRAKAHQRRNIAQRPMLAIGGARYQRVERIAPSIYLQHEKPSAELMDLKMIRQSVAGDTKRLPVALASFALGFANLPGSEEEAKRVASTYGGAEAGARDITGRYATESTWNALVASGELAQYKNIHIAAHGFLSDDDPALSSIVLGQVQREPGTDGYLTAAELSAVDLNTDLVVVSACNSGVSGYIEGEGMQGLAYSMFEAGTRHVLLTLWPIGDKSTVAFMDKFYDQYRSGKTHSITHKSTDISRCL